MALWFLFFTSFSFHTTNFLIKRERYRDIIRIFSLFFYSLIYVLRNSLEISFFFSLLEKGQLSLLQREKPKNNQLNNMLPTQLFVTPTTTTMTSSGSHQDLADFASSMVYLMWHARKTTKALVSERSYSPSLVGNDLAYLMWQSRKPMTKAQHYSPLGGDQSFSYTASPAFKKFCYQVNNS